jgi:hypothetical protein
MQNRGLVALSILVIIISCISFVNAQAVSEMGPDYKYSYARTYSEAQLAASGITITADDIAYARMRVKSAEDDCAEMGGVWCDYAKDDRNALQKMLNVQARQSGNPQADVTAGNPGRDADIGSIISSALNQLVNLVKGIIGWD